MNSHNDLAQGPKCYEFYYVDKDGLIRDEELWNEILGTDDQDVVQVKELPIDE